MSATAGFFDFLETRVHGRCMVQTNLKIYRRVAKDAKKHRVEWVTAEDARPKTQDP